MSEVRGLKTEPGARPTCLCWEEKKPTKEKDGAASGVEGTPGESGQEAESSSEPVVTGSDAAEKQDAGRGRASGLRTW